MRESRHCAHLSGDQFSGGRGLTPGSAQGRISPNLLFLYRKIVNISHNYAFGRREKNGVQKALGGGGAKRPQKMVIFCLLTFSFVGRHSN